MPHQEPTLCPCCPPLLSSLTLCPRHFVRGKDSPCPQDLRDTGPIAGRHRGSCGPPTWEVFGLRPEGRVMFIRLGLGSWGSVEGRGLLRAEGRWLLAACGHTGGTSLSSPHTLPPAASSSPHPSRSRSACLSGATSGCTRTLSRPPASPRLSRKACWGGPFGGWKQFADGARNQAVGFWRRQNYTLHFSAE